LTSPSTWVTSATLAKSRQQEDELCSAGSERSGAAEPKNPEAAGNSHKGMHAYEAKSRRTCAGSKTLLQVTTWKRVWLTGMQQMAYLPFRQNDLDRLQNSKTTVRRAVRELPLANIRLCGAKTALPTICKVHGGRLHQVTALPAGA